jgi:hypothetical protein
MSNLNRKIFLKKLILVFSELGPKFFLKQVLGSVPIPVFGSSSSWKPVPGNWN